jgi:SAM-dependent methyltransferase
MTPDQVAKSYDALAEHWNSERFSRANGIAQHERAIRFTSGRGKALDVGCGSSGRIIDLMLKNGFEPAGIDASERMLELARARHPDITFHRGDICRWELPHPYDFISAWDSIWHVPLSEHEHVLRKLLSGLGGGGVCIFTTGGLDAPGEVQDSAMGVPMYHSTLGIPRVLEVVSSSGCVCRHLEYDQYPEQHAYVIAQRLDE